MERMIRLLPATKRFEQIADADMVATLEPLADCNGAGVCLPHCKPFGHVHVGVASPGATMVLVLIFGEHDGHARDVEVREMDVDDASWLIDSYRAELRTRRWSPRRSPRWRR